MKKPRSVSFILTLIVIAQFACTSLWFAGNAVVNDLVQRFSLSSAAAGHITSTVQFGFIGGTLVFALLGIADRFSPSRIFFCCAMLAAAINLSLFLIDDYKMVMITRACTGFLLAGIYPVGMKIAADHHEKGLGKALGWLVGALVLGTAFPHLVHVFTKSLSWQWVIAICSLLSATGGVLVLLLVPDGPFRTKATAFYPARMIWLFTKAGFRHAAFGYFGHMWELYSFWAFVPFILQSWADQHVTVLPLSLLAFIVIAMGTPACIIGGFLSQKYGSAKTAFTALSISGLCCVLSPFLFGLPFFLFLFFLLIWGMAVITDSPQFSTLVAQSIPAEIRGTALTITNSIGFAITILSIETINSLRSIVDPKYLCLFLAIGPLIGLLSMRRLRELRIRN